MRHLSGIEVLSEYFRFLNSRNKASILVYSGVSSLLTLIEFIAVWLSVKTIEIVGAIAKSDEIPSLNIFILENLISEFSLTFKLAFLATMTFTLFIARSVLQIIINKTFLERLGKVASRISIDGMQNISKQNILGANYKKLSEIEYSLTTGVDKAILTIIGSLSILFSDVLLILVTLIFLFTYDTSTSIVLICFGLTSFLLVNQFATKRLKAIGREKAKLDISLSSDIKDTLSIAGEARTTSIFETLIHKITKKRLRQGELYSLQTIFPYLSKYVLELGFLFFAAILSAYKLKSGTIVDVAAALGILFLGGSRLTPALLRIQQSLQAISGGMGPAEESLKVLRNGSEVSKNTIHKKLQGPPKIVVQDLTFSWPNSKTIFQNINLEIQPKELTCLRGKTGSGKTTLARLIIGDLKPEAGTVDLSTNVNHNIHDSKYPVYVPQEPHLLNSNLATNLFLTSDQIQIRKLEIQKLMKQLDLSVFLEFLNLESNLQQTVVHEISRGERQRLGILRALLQESYMYIFDEPTSALDKNTAVRVINSLRQISKSATVIVITHDQEILKVADKIFDINNFKTKKAINSTHLNKIRK
jgi:ABC-type transport system involved in cytochrome bd biosynthesis fused ATPase/permease subunit